MEGPFLTMWLHVVIDLLHVSTFKVEELLTRMTRMFGSSFARKRCEATLVELPIARSCLLSFVIRVTAGGINYLLQFCAHILVILFH